MNKNILFIFIISIFLLGGCASALDSMLTKSSPSEVLRKAEEAHSELTGVEVSFVENYKDFTDTGSMVIDIAGNESYITLDEDNLSIYINDDDTLVEYSSGEVESWGDSGVFAEVEDMVALEKNPLTYYKDIDNDIYDKFDLEKEKNQYILTYTGSKDDAEHLGKAITFYQLTGLDDFDETIDLLDMEVKEFDLKLVINSASFLVEKIEQQLTYKFEDDPEDTEVNVVHEFDKYDDIGEIVRLEATVADGEGLNKKDNGDTKDLKDEDKELYEKEAAEYVDALIQATVFQDADKFIKKAPKSMSEEDKKSEAEVQRDFFKEIYIQNTKDNMEGTGVTDKEISDLADAFLKALSTTKYEIVDSEAISDEDFVVTVSIQGIDDSKVYQDTEDQLYDVVMKEDFSEDEIFSKNMELLIKNYKGVDSLLDPVEVKVDVTKKGEGSYLVVMQDQFLVGGFVQ